MMSSPFGAAPAHRSSSSLPRTRCRGLAGNFPPGPVRLHVGQGPGIFDPGRVRVSEPQSAAAAAGSLCGNGVWSATELPPAEFTLRTSSRPWRCPGGARPSLDSSRSAHTRVAGDFASHWAMMVELMPEVPRVATAGAGLLAARARASASPSATSPERPRSAGAGIPVRSRRPWRGRRSAWSSRGRRLGCRLRRRRRAAQSWGPEGPARTPARPRAELQWRLRRRRLGTHGAGVRRRSSGLTRVGAALAARVGGRQATAGRGVQVSWEWGLSGTRGGARGVGGPGRLGRVPVFAWPWRLPVLGCGGVAWG